MVEIKKLRVLKVEIIGVEQVITLLEIPTGRIYEETFARGEHRVVYEGDEI